MPTYEYICDACEHEFELEQRISEKPLDTCPKCSKKKARRQISRGAFILKGGGWYSDLYAGATNKKEKPDKSSDAPKAEGSKQEGSKQEGSKSESPKSESPRSESPRSESPKSESPKQERRSDSGGSAKAPATQPA